MNKQWSTADLCDSHGDKLSVLDLGFENFGAVKKCAGEVSTVKLVTDNAVLIELLNQPGKQRVAVVQSAETNAALVGDKLATLAINNGWAGLIIDGAVRDTETLATMALPVFATNVWPIRGAQTGGGETDVELMVGGVPVRSGDWIYADADGVAVSSEKLEL